MSEKIKSLLNQLTARPGQVVTGTVLSVDKEAMTCDVARDDEGADHLQVRLRAVVDGGQDGLVLFPVKGSNVTLLLLDEDTSLVIQYSAVEVYSIRTATESLKSILSDFLDEIGQMVFTTNQGPTDKLVNALAFVKIKQRLNGLLSD
jgi:ribosomal protein S1